MLCDLTHSSSYWTHIQKVQSYNSTTKTYLTAYEFTDILTIIIDAFTCIGIHGPLVTSH